MSSHRRCKYKKFVKNQINQDKRAPQQCDIAGRGYSIKFCTWSGGSASSRLSDDFSRFISSKFSYILRCDFCQNFAYCFSTFPTLSYTTKAKKHPFPYSSLQGLPPSGFYIDVVETTMRPFQVFCLVTTFARQKKAKISVRRNIAATIVKMLAMQANLTRKWKISEQDSTM